jgi:outer membrane lipoprotein SlyB
MKNKKQLFKVGSLISLSAIAVLFSGCGKNETAGGTFGAATGALVGTAVAGRHDKATGAVIGGLVGNLFGREVGKSADKEEAAEKRFTQQRKLAQLKEENELLKRSYDRWCQDCGKKVTLFGAQSCPKCGGCLIRHKYCQECGTKFEAQCGYRFCPYCPRSRLHGRG